MGFLGFLGKVAKAGLSTVTGGISDKILAAAKSTGVDKMLRKKAAGGMLTDKDQVKVFALGQRDGSGNAWGTTQGPTSAAANKIRATTSASYVPRVVDTTKRTTKRRKRVKAATTTGSGRKPPKGGLDLKAMAKQWAAAGKPGKWIDWVKVKSHQIRKG